MITISPQPFKPMATDNLLFLWFFFILEISVKSFQMWLFFQVWVFIISYVLKVHSSMGCVCTSFVILLCGQKSSVCPFIRATDIGLFPLVDSYAERTATPCLPDEERPESLPKQLRRFTFLTATEEGSNVSTSSPALVIAWAIKAVETHRHFGNTVFGTWIHSDLAAAFRMIHCSSVVGLNIEHLGLVQTATSEVKTEHSGGGMRIGNADADTEKRA